MNITGMGFKVSATLDEHGYHQIILENDDIYSWEDIKQLVSFVEEHKLIENK